MADYSLFSETPALAPNADSSVTLGIAFRVDTETTLTAVRYLQPTSGSTAARTMAVYPLGGGVPVAGPFTMPTPTAGTWCTYTLPTPVTLPPEQYRVAVFHPAGDYPATAAYFTTGPGSTDAVSGPLTRLAAGITENGTYGYGGSLQYPLNNGNGGNYWVDVVVSDAAGLDLTASASLSGSGTLSAAGSPGLGLSANLSGSGTLTASVTTLAEAAVAFSGAGTLSGAASTNMATLGALSGAGALTAQVKVSLSTGGLLSGAGALALDPVMQYTAWVASDSEGTLSAGLVVGMSATADLAGDGILAGLAGDRPTAEFIGSSTGTLAAVVRPAFAVAAALGGTGVLAFALQLSGRDVIVTAYLPNNTRYRAVLPDNRWEAHL